MRASNPLFALLSAIALSAVSTSIIAAPVTLGFEGVVADVNAQVPATPYVESGFTLSNSVNSINNNGIFGKNASNSNGSATFVFCSFDSGCTNGTAMVLTGTSPFSLDSLEVGNWQTGQGAGTMELIGSIFGGGTVTTTLNTGDAWSTNFLSGFTNLTSVEFRGHTTYAVAFDNLTINGGTVPEPSSLALMGLAIAAFGFGSRKRA